MGGATLQYSNGHSLDWLETDPAVIAKELELIGLINDHRTSLGLPELQFDRTLTRCARGHSRHHGEHGFFTGHDNPEGEGFTDRMINNGLDFEISGENIRYGALDAQEVFDGWLNSPDHRANLERLCFVRIGVGYHGLVWTADFAR
jgi:uncharacterized protein YkwD